MNRYLSIDTLRGLIMIIMAIDHAIGALATHPIPEVAIAPFFFPGYSSPAQHLSRLLTHLCAPGFQLFAGMGLALSVARAQRQGVSQWIISRDLLIRGAVLILIEYALMGFIYLSHFLFLVLCCIGSCTICFAILRFLPKHLIGLLGVLIIGLAPYYGPTSITSASQTTYLVDIWTHVAFSFSPWFNVMYPILPWLGIFALGWWIGLLFDEPREQENLKKQGWLLIAGGLAITLAAVALRAMGITYAERIPLSGASVFELKFWQFAKYPPSLVFMMLTIGILLVLLGCLRFLDGRARAPWWCRIVSVYGRTALFYFVVHFYALTILAWHLEIPGWQQNAKHFSIGVAYLGWLGVVVLLWPVCWGYDKLRQKYRGVLRYF